ncbi:hypothetical protein [Actinomadura harenae]|uniref:Uncharacterized protein n=1 Tax=Actinomadura harenae TaxID=2483351 RepID=A0A3M2MBW3_9ACTN|nr:hypothetical protein [Actinomadura harenae]RMI46393.1 hypothetical protein EBO15_07505 [Actinomadura harenae]
MPCFRCGARQTDPVRGASPWRRGVLADHQVLVCPACQAAGGWSDALDHCSCCGSAALVCRLGDVECRECGHTREAVRDEPGRAPEPAPAAPSPGADLSQEVAAALDRVLGRPLT